jgi:hypothetical protein
MPATVLLSDIVDALDVQLDEYSSFLDLDSGKVESVADDLLRLAEDREEDSAPELPDWQQEQWEVAKQIVSSERFLPLPSKYDVNEWEIMQDFSISVTPESVRDDLLRAIHGSGAFRRFKDTVRDRGVESAWFEFRAAAFKKIAADWCNENAIVWR